MTFARPEAEAELLAALEEIGEGDGFDLDSIDLPLDDGPPLDVDGEAAEARAAGGRGTRIRARPTGGAPVDPVRD